MDELVWLDEALQDLDEIGSYIALDNPHAAENVVRRIVEAVSMLAWHPKVGRLTSDGDAGASPSPAPPTSPFIASANERRYWPYFTRPENGRTI
jgi:plasmid stabilization system protein ParE